MHFLKNPRFISGAIGIAFVASLFSGVTFAQASSLTSVQVQAITNLLQSFGVDPSTITNVQAVLENQATSTQSASSPGESSSFGGSSQPQSGNGCSVLSGNLQPGSTDQSTNGEVSQLQTFLGKDKSIYPEDLVTGYFGSSTEHAVQRWQTANGIVSSGDPQSTGYGDVGPRTRGEMDKEMEVECEQGGSQNSSDSTASSTQERSSGSESDAGGNFNISTTSSMQTQNFGTGDH